MQTLFCKQYQKGDLSKPPLVLLHGFLGEHSDWRAMVDSLPEHIGCYALDLPGHGASKNVELAAERGFEQCSQLISTTLSQFGIHRYILAGYSLGGRVALYHALRRPHEIAALVLESSHGGLTQQLDQQQRWRTDNAWAQRFINEPLAAVLAPWYQQGVFSELTFEQRTQLLFKRQNNNGVLMANTLLALSLAKQGRLMDKLTIGAFPCFYFYSDRDHKYAQLAIKYQGQHPDLVIVNFKKAGHNIHLVQPLEYANQIVTIYRQLQD